MRLCFVVGCLLLGLPAVQGGAARADEGAAVTPPVDRGVEKQARDHYTAGKTLYELGNYSDALRELLLGYSLVQKPQFLLNLGQCYRRLDELGKAREMYVKYLASAPPDDRSRAQVERLMAEIDRQIADKEEAEKARVVAAAPREVKAAPAVAIVAPVVVVTKRSGARHLAWVVPTILLLGAGGGVGIYFAVRPTCSASFACISATGN